MINTVIVTFLVLAPIIAASVDTPEVELHTIEKRQTTATNERIFICVYDTRNEDRPPAIKMYPAQMNPRLCTHMTYAYSEIDIENGLHPRGGNKDNEQDKYSLFNNLKRYNKNLKTLLFVDSPTTKEVSDVLLSEPSRREVMKKMIQHLRRNNFDGVTLRFIFVTPFEKTKDKYTYNFIKEFREEIEIDAAASKRTKLTFGMTFPYIDDHIEAGLDLKQVMQYADFITVYLIGYHNVSDGFTSHHSPLYSIPDYSDALDKRLTIDYTISNLIDRGVDPSKIVMGLTTNGFAYTLFSPEITDLGSRVAGPGNSTVFKALGKSWTPYYEMCSKVKNEEGWTVVYANKTAIGPYAYKEDQWVGYDDPDSVREKTKYAIDRRLGGITLSYLDQDDFTGKCHGKPFPMFEAVKEVLETYKITSTGTKIDTNTETSSGSDEVHFPSSKPGRVTPAPGKGTSSYGPTKNNQKYCVVPKDTDDRTFWATCEESNTSLRTATGDNVIRSGGVVGQGCMLQIKCKTGYSFYNTNSTAAVCSGQMWFPAVPSCYPLEMWQTIQNSSQMPKLPENAGGPVVVAYPIVINNIYPPAEPNKCDCTESRRKTRASGNPQ